MADSVLVPRMTVTTGDVFIPALWTNQALIAREASKVMSNLVERYDEDAADGGDIIHIPLISNLDANEKVASTIVTVQAPTETEVTLSLNRHFEASIIIEDRLAKQQKKAYNLLAKYSSKSGEAVARKMDSDLTGLYSNLSQSVGDGNTAISDTNVIRAVQYLDDALAPDMDRFFVVKPAGYADLRAINRFTENQYNGDGSAIATGKIGQLYGVTVYKTTQIATVAGSPSVVHSLMFQREAFALAVQMDLRVQFQYKQEYLGTLCTADSLWGFAEQRDDHAVDFRHSA